AGAPSDERGHHGIAGDLRWPAHHPHAAARLGHRTLTSAGTARRERLAVKTVREFYKECFQAEKPKFLRVIQAVPPDQADYRPHPRSTSAGDLVWLLACELRDACELIDRGEVTYVAEPAPPIPEAIAAYEKYADALER